MISSINYPRLQDTDMFLQHKYFLFEALKAAMALQGQCSPNPAVGAVVVSDNHIISRGTHQGPGHAHAEIAALDHLDNAQATTLYVTLEPCCHYGRTPPCTERIIKEKIKAVYYAYADPNPQVAGKGAEQLRQAGIQCEQIELAEINDFYRAYEYWWKTKKPWVQAKLAISSNGKVAGVHKHPQMITGKEAQAFTHFMRSQADAILTTAETVICDDPRLNVRDSFPMHPACSLKRNEGETRKPVYVLDSKLRFPESAKLHQTASEITLFYSQEVPINTLAQFQARPYRLIEVSSKNAELCLDEILSKIGADGVQTLWVEAGPTLWMALHQKAYVHQTFLYCSVKNLPTEAYGLNLSVLESLFQKDELRYCSLGEDTLITIDR